jgi:hypothetical protein
MASTTAPNAKAVEILNMASLLSSGAAIRLTIDREVLIEAEACIP